MSKEQQVSDFLKGRYIAGIATENDDGSIHQVSVWYVHRDGKLYVGSNSGSRKVRNIRARPRAGLIIDSRRSTKECGASTYGTARIIEGDESKALNTLIRERYLTKAGNEDQRVGPVFAAFDDITIEITPGRWTWWDCAVLDATVFGGAIGDNQYILPLDG